MTIDERLDKLTERHEALTQTVEIIAGMQRENEVRFARMAEAAARADERIEKMAAKIDQLTDIVNDHDERINDLEDKDEKRRGS